MKQAILAALLACGCAVAFAQNAPVTKATSSKPAASSTKKAAPAAKAATPKASSKTAAKKPAPKRKKVAPDSSRAQLNTTAANVAAGVAAADDALSPAELELARNVSTGHIACGMGSYVNVTADPKVPGYFDVDGKGFRYRMSPVASKSGAVRLEDNRTGGVWLQTSTKSMLINQKAGERVADDCKTPEQDKFAQEWESKSHPSILSGKP